MRKQILILLLLLISLHFPCKSQIIVKVQTGISYIEHFSAGITFDFSEKQAISLFYGSNFLVNPNYFSSYMLEYDRFIKQIKFFGITPKIGIKGGYSIFTDEYYKWRLIVIVPFIGFNYHITNKTEAFIDLGITYSREESLRRIKYGEIGSYKDYLPEIKIGLYFNLSR